LTNGGKHKPSESAKFQEHSFYFGRPAIWNNLSYLFYCITDTALFIVPSQMSLDACQSNVFTGVT